MGLEGCEWLPLLKGGLFGIGLESLFEGLRFLLLFNLVS